MDRSYYHNPKRRKVLGTGEKLAAVMFDDKPESQAGIAQVDIPEAGVSILLDQAGYVGLIDSRKKLFFDFRYRGSEKNVVRAFECVAAPKGLARVDVENTFRAGAGSDGKVVALLEEYGIAEKVEAILGGKHKPKAGILTLSGPSTSDRDEPFRLTVNWDAFMSRIDTVLEDFAQTEIPDEQIRFIDHKWLETPKP